MGPGYLIRREPDQSDGYHNEKRADHAIKYNEPKENQAAAKQTFGFPGSLTSKYPAKQDGEHEVRICELIVEISKGFSIGKDRLYREGGLFYGKQNCTEHRFLSWKGGN